MGEDGEWREWWQEGLVVFSGRDLEVCLMGGRGGVCCEDVMIRTPAVLREGQGSCDGVPYFFLFGRDILLKVCIKRPHFDRLFELSLPSDTINRTPQYCEVQIFSRR